MSSKNLFFAKYGHECEISSARDDLPMFKAGGNIITQIRNLITRSRMASELNSRGNMFLRSQLAVDLEHQKHIKHLYIIHPFSVARKWWEAFMIFVFFVVFVTIPLDLASYMFPLKNNLNSSYAWKFFRFLFDIFCCCDVVMNFFTGFCDKVGQEIVMLPRRIAMRYLLTYFIPDLLSSLPSHIDIISSEFMISRDFAAFLQYASCLKLLRFFTFKKYCRRCSEAFNLHFILYRACFALFCYILFFHLLTCSNIIIIGVKSQGDFEKIFTGPNDYYINFKDLKNGSMHFAKGYLQFLLDSIYMGCHAETSEMFVLYIHQIYFIAVWIVSKIVFFHLVFQLFEIVTSSKSSSNKYTEMVRELREYMRHKQLPENLQRRLIGYYEFRFQKSYFRESEILNIISGQLKQDLVMHSCRKLVENVAFFQNLPLPLIIRIVSALITEIFLVNDVIIKVNACGDCMYFIASGCVAVYTKSGHEVTHLEDGDYFGELSLIYQGASRESSIVAIELCELYRLERAEFVKAIMPYPDLLDKITRHALERLEVTEYHENRFAAMSQQK